MPQIPRYYLSLRYLQEIDLNKLDYRAKTSVILAKIYVQKAIEFGTVCKLTNDCYSGEQKTAQNFVLCYYLGV